MLAYTIRRLLYVIPLVFGVALVTFGLFNVTGWNPAYQTLGQNARPEAIAALEHELGLDRPLPIQFVDYLGQIVTMDFGRSLATRQKISTMILDGIGPSLMLTLPVFIIGLVVAIALGLIVAYYRARFIDRAIVVFTVLGMSTTSLAYIIFGQYFLAYKWDLFPISGFEWGPAGVKYFLLPWVIWFVAGLGAQVRFYRTVMLDEIGQDYVRTAYAKGLSRNVVLFKHVLKNAMIPIITNVVIVIPFLFLGSLLLESFFGIPGLGSMLINAINNVDYPVIKAMVVILAVLYIVFNLISDLCYALVNPRVQLR